VKNSPASEYLYRLYLVHIPGCGVCRDTKAAAKAWLKEHPEVKLVPVDITRVEWKAQSWIPSIAPTLLLMTPNGKVHKREHGAEKQHIDEWVAKVAPELLRGR